MAIDFNKFKGGGMNTGSIDFRKFLPSSQTDEEKKRKKKQEEVDKIMAERKISSAKEVSEMGVHQNVGKNILQGIKNIKNTLVEKLSPALKGGGVKLLEKNPVYNVLNKPRELKKQTDLEKAQRFESMVEKKAKILTAPVRWTAGSLATAGVSYALEKADSNLRFTPKTDAQKLLIGENEIQRLTKQEDLYGSVARGVGIPAAIITMAVLENPFLQGTGIGAGIKKILTKNIGKDIAKVATTFTPQKFLRVVDEAVQTEVKAGKITSEQAEKFSKEITNLKVNEVSPTGVPLPKVPAVSQRISDQAIEAGLAKDLGELPEIERVSFADQAKRVGQIIDEDPERAIRIAKLEEAPPEGLLPESVFIAVKNQAIEKGDINLLRELATSNTGVAAEATRLGQRIKMLDERLEDDVFKNIRDVNKMKENAYKGNIKADKQKEVVSMKTKLREAVPTADEWETFINELTC